MITNKMAWVVIPKRMIANGNQAMDGSVWSPVISDPTAARSGPDPGHQRADDRADQHGQGETR